MAVSLTENWLEGLANYYKRLFPSLQLYLWLNYGKANTLSKREISFILSTGRFIRFQSFDTHEAFLNDLCNRNPVVINVGAVYVTKPKGTHRLIEPIAKEITFDIDITDYDDIRTCCSGFDVCIKCWQFVAIASKIIDNALREDFDFKHILWVFSGRRGIHGWVCDEQAKKLNDETRLMLTRYLQIIGGSQYTDNRVKLPGNIHPSLKRALSIIDTYFIKSIVKDQDILGTDERLNNFLEKIDYSIRMPFKVNMNQVTSSFQRWEAFEWTLADLQSKIQIPTNLRNLKEEIKLYYAYPRLDIAVSTNISHLLKSPFSVHRKTEKICVLFDVNSVDKFDPNNVPTLTTVFEELSAYGKKVTGPEVFEIQDYEKTSLLGPVRLFTAFLNDLEKIKVENVKTEFQS